MHLIGWEQICQWKPLTKCLMKCPPGNYFWKCPLVTHWSHPFILIRCIKLIVILDFMFAPNSPACPPGWLFGTNKCYLFTEKSTGHFSEAQSSCESLHYAIVQGQPRYPSLLVIESGEETEGFLMLRNHTKRRYWLNCEDRQHDMEWGCRTDRNGTISTYRS